MVSTSHSNNKISYHVVINKIVDGKTYAYMTNKKDYENSAYDLYIALTGYNGIYSNIIDKTVYSIDREFRTIYSYKSSKDMRQFIPITANQEDHSIIDNVTDYLITYINNPIYIKTPYVKKKIYKIEKNNAPIHYVEQLARTVHPTARYTGTSSSGSWRFTYINRNEPCYTNNLHKSNGFYIYQYNGNLYIRCMSQLCPNGKYLGKY
jgi:hypothetical protein